MIIEIREEGALIEGFKPGYYGCDCCHKDDCGCPDTGDTPTPPGPEPPTPDTGITSIHIIVADTITDSGRASAVFTPATADTSLYFSSSDEDIAEIDPDTGEITVIQTGVVTFCVEDLLTGLEDCKVVNVIKSEPEPPVTGITAITIVVDDVITDFGIATSVFQPATAETQLVYTSTDESVAVIDPETGEIEVIRTGSVTFCVEDLLTNLMDCKTVSVIKSGGQDSRLKVIYYRRANDTSYKLLSVASGITRAEFEDGTVVENPGNDFNHSFETEGLHTVYYTLQSNELNDKLFYYIYNVIRVEIPSGVTRIGSYCFCSMLRFSSAPPGRVEFVIPNTIVEVDEGAFSGLDGNIVLPEGVRRIGKECFVSEYITSVTIPSTVVSIGQDICKGCIRLETVNILCNVSAFSNLDWNHFAYCPSLYYFSGPSASSDHRMLITDDNVAISFAAGGGLRSYTTPLGIEKIGRWCIASDRYVDEFPTQIEEITVSEGVKYIEDFAFNCHNSALRRVYLPSTLLDMSGEQVFYGRSNLADIYCYAQTAPLVARNTFLKGNEGWFPNNGTLHYPAGSNYSSWLSNASHYLGYYGWTGQEITG